MTVIRNVPQAPTDLVVQGEQFRLVALVMGIQAGGVPTQGSITGNLKGSDFLIAGEHHTDPMTGTYPTPPREVLYNPFEGTMTTANAFISTPCGALYPTNIGQHVMDVFLESTQTFTITGQTLTGTGTALGNCRVVALETGRLAVSGAAIVNETISDAGGNFSFAVPMNTAYELIAYSPGAPEKGGVTLPSVTPGTITNIYLRDPTTQDAAGTSASANLLRGKL